LNRATHPKIDRKENQETLILFLCFKVKCNWNVKRHYEKLIFLHPSYQTTWKIKSITEPLAIRHFSCIHWIKIQYLYPVSARWTLNFHEFYFISLRLPDCIAFIFTHNREEIYKTQTGYKWIPLTITDLRLSLHYSYNEKCSKVLLQPSTKYKNTK
jgi:hypothetical protein